MKKKLCAVILVLSIVQISLAQNVIKGKVYDAETNLPLAGASVVIKNLNSGTTTNANGEFTIESQEIVEQLHISHIGYRSTTIKVSGNILEISLKPESSEIDEVVVTATKTERLAHEVPASISIVKSAEIENTPVVYADEALRYVPGVYQRRSKFSDATASVSMRGFEGNARTLVLLDGQPLNDGYNHGLIWSAIPTDNINRIEVIKGPFSSLYGGNAMGGVINIITELPDKEAINFRASYGTYNTFTTHLAYGNKLTENIRFYISWDKKYAEGYPTNFYVKTASDGEGDFVVTGWEKTKTSTGDDAYLIGHKGDNYYDQNQYFGKIQWDISKKTNLNFSCNLSDQTYGYKNPQSDLVDSEGNPVNDGSFTIIDNGVSKKISVKPYSFIQGPGSGYRNSYKIQFNTSINQIRLSSNAGLVDDYTWYISSASGANEEGGPGKRNITYPKRAYLFNIQGDIPIRKHTLTLGADYRLNNAKGEEWNLSDWEDKESKTTLSTSMEGKQQILAGFAQLELVLHDNVKAYLGARYDHWKNFKGESYDASEDILITYQKYTNSYISPKIAMVYTPNLKSDFWQLNSIRISAGNAFRPPTLYNMYKTWYYYGTFYESNPDLKPEVTKSWEIGADQSLFSDKTKLSTSYYQSYITNLIYNNLIEEDHKKYENAGKGEIKGIEAEIKQYVTNWLDAYFNITYQKTKITENEADLTTIGKQFTNVPRLMYNAGCLFHYNKANIGIYYHFAEKEFGSDDNSDTETGVYGAHDEVSLLDTKISYRIVKNMNISLSINNILDKQYYVYYKAPGRTFTINLLTKF